jgi:hypothetical protein
MPWGNNTGRVAHDHGRERNLGFRLMSRPPVEAARTPSIRTWRLILRRAAIGAPQEPTIADCSKGGWTGGTEPGRLI